MIGSLRKINCTLQNALAEKAAWRAAMCHASLVSKSLDPKPFFLIAPLSLRNSATAAPQNQLQFANALVEKPAWWAAG